MKLILDVMGGDHALRSSIEGALKALPDLRGGTIELVLLGDERIIRAHLAKRRLPHVII